MNARILAVALVVSTLSSVATAAPKATAQLVTERAWANALRPSNASGRCWAKIGLGPAKALLRYCKEFAPSLHARCHSANTCETLTDSIWGWCKETRWDPIATGEAKPDPTHLPCENTEHSADWKRISGFE